MSKQKVWGGRFEGATHPDVEKFTSSLSVDKRLFRADCRCSAVHARALGRAGVLTAEEAKSLSATLETLSDAVLRPDAEDIHSEIERLLFEKLGPLAGKLHAGRSRNDQVVTATRLYLREAIDGLIREVVWLQKELIRVAEKHLETLLPGLTHFQHAQPVTLAHHLMAYFWMLERDSSRLRECRRRVNLLPAGSAALAGTSFPIDRQWMAEELGFDGICENSLDAVSDRDFVVEFLADASLVMTHLSRFAEELIIWNNPRFAFVELSDGVTTGSSIMPQKKNPDVLELIRGRTGKVFGDLQAMLVTLKGTPLAYNRDFQEDKTYLFDGLDTVCSCVQLFGLVLKDAVFNKENMENALKGDFSNATELADYLVGKGVPFREAHETTGKVVRYCLTNHKALEALTLEELRSQVPAVEEDVLEKLTHRAGVSVRKLPGGTSPDAVRSQLAKAKETVGCY